MNAEEASYDSSMKIKAVFVLSPLLWYSTFISFVNSSIFKTRFSNIDSLLWEKNRWIFLQR